MRAVLALHCALASGAAWRAVAAHLPDCAFAAPDLPGHGTAAPLDPSERLMNAALRRALAAMPDGPVDVVGHSYGACLAMRLLVEHPARIRSLALVEPVLFAAHPEAVAWDARMMAPFRAALDSGDREGAAGHFHGLWGAGRWDALPPRLRRAIVARIHLIGASADELASDVHRILPRLPADAAPLLVTRRDPPLPVARIAEGLAGRMAGTERVELGEGHMIPMEAPEALAGLLAEHWARA